MPLTIQIIHIINGLEMFNLPALQWGRLSYIKLHGLHSHKHTWIISHAHNYKHTCKITVPYTFRSLGILPVSLAYLSERPDWYFKLDTVPSS